MDIETFHRSRRFAEVKSGRIAYFEQGQGPVALFIHGVPLNGYHWRHVIERVQHQRRCIAIDLMGLGYTEIAPAQDVLRLGKMARMNVPGQATGNWTWRMQGRAIMRDVVEELAEMTEIFGRAPGTSA